MNLIIGALIESLTTYLDGKEDPENFFDYKKLKKNECYLNIGDKQLELAVLVHGKLISKYEYEYFDSKYDSEEFVSKIYHSNEDKMEGHPFVVNHESYFYDKVSTEVILAIEDSMIVVFKKKIINAIMKSDEVLKNIFEEFEESSYLELTQRLKDLQSLSTEHKIEKFHKESPELINIKNEYIISFLGIRSKSTYYDTISKMKEKNIL